MEWSEKTAAAVAEWAGDERDERPIDGEFTLPDYCPEVAAILKCLVEPMIQTRQIAGDRVTAEGVVLIRVLYLDEERTQVYSCDFTQPFSGSFTLKKAVGPSPSCDITARTEYVNCRATGPRRIDIHGAFSLRLRLLCAGTVTLLAPPEEEGLCVRTQTVPTTVPAAAAEKNFTVSEVLDIGGRAPIAALLRTGCAVQTEPPTRLSGKLVLKGLLTIDNVYRTEAGDIESVTHEIPFDQLLDIEGLKEDMLCDVRPSVAAREVRVTPNQAGANTLLSVTVKLTVGVTAYAAGEASVVTDAFSSRCPVKAETSRLTFTALRDIDTARHTVREQVELPEDVERVLDIWVDTPSAAQSRGEDGAAVCGQLNMCMLARDRAGQIGYYERTADYRLPLADADGERECRVAPLHTDYTPGAGTLAVTVTLLLTCLRQTTETVDCVTALSADENAAYPPRKAALKLYYAAAGESLWAIAKTCRAPLAAVSGENGLTGDTVPDDRLLLIPLNT